MGLCSSILASITNLFLACRSSRSSCSISSWSSASMSRSSSICLWDSSRCFMRTATTTLTSTNWAMSTNTTK
uniref:Putative secreted protein n=1 Tax=Ixodes ricinus TaxID=34613 RepID=A0A6B0U3C5_IXORI